MMSRRVILAERDMDMVCGKAVGYYVMTMVRVVVVFVVVVFVVLINASHLKGFSMFLEISCWHCLVLSGN